MFKRLRNKLLMMNMIIISIVILGAFSVIYLTTYNNINNENKRKLNDMSGYSMTIHGSDDVVEDSDFLNNESSVEINNSMHFNLSEYTPSFIIIVNENNEIINIDTFLDIPREIYVEAVSLIKKDTNNNAINFYNRKWIYSSSPYIINVISENNEVQEVFNGEYQIAFLDITDSQKTLNDLLFTFIIVTIVVLVITFFISLYFAQRSIKPIMEAWYKQKQFIADASHELKTPLAIINANYDVLMANEKETIKSQKEWLEYIQKGTNRMTKLINDLLFLAKMENIEISINKEDFNISNIINESIYSMEVMINEKEINLISSIEPNIIINNNQELVIQLFLILYENAIKYTDNKGIIEIKLIKDKQQIICNIKNTGKGIKKEDINKIFDRFYRSDLARTGDNGYGLGLSIAKTLIERLNGQISVESEENNYTSFTFKLSEII